MDAPVNGVVHSDGESNPEADHSTDDASNGAQFRLISSPRRSSRCPASLLLQAAAGLEAMNSYRATVVAVGNGQTVTTASKTPPIAPTTPTVSSPSPTTPRSDIVQQQHHHQQQQHRGPQPISPPPPSPQISAAELSMLTEASATTNGTFQCTLCSKQFGYKNGLIRHVRLTHVGEKPYQCTICNRRFGYKHILMEHQNLHFGNRPYACALCDKRFAARSNLIQHRMVHRRPYTCSLCPKRFDREDQLKKHLFAHPQSNMPTGNGCAPIQSLSATSSAAMEMQETRAKRRRGSSATVPDDIVSSSPPGHQVRLSSGSAAGNGTDDDGSAGKPADDDDSNFSRGSSLSPEPDDYTKPLAALTSAASSVGIPPPSSTTKLQLPHSGASGLRIDAICSQLSSSVSGVDGDTVSHHHLQRHHSHQNGIGQSQLLGGGLFQGVVVKKEKLELGEGGFDHYGGLPIEFNSASRRHSSSRTIGGRQNGIELEDDKSLIHHIGLPSSSAQYPLTSFAAWPSPSARHSTTNSLSAMSVDFPMSVSVGSHHQQTSTGSSSSSSSALPGIHEVFSRRLANATPSFTTVQKLPSFANFMPPQAVGSHQLPAMAAPSSMAASSGHSSSYRVSSSAIPELGTNLQHSPTAVGDVKLMQSVNQLSAPGSILHQSSNGISGHGVPVAVASAPQMLQQSGVVNPTTRPTAQLPPISLQPLPSSNLQSLSPTPHRTTKDQGVQHSQTVAGFPSLDDVLSYYVSQGRLFRCQHCNILFFERGMYFLHASLHGLNSPWECSICHRVCSDKNEFTLHFVNQQHNC